MAYHRPASPSFVRAAQILGALLLATLLGCGSQPVRQDTDSAPLTADTASETSDRHTTTDATPGEPSSAGAPLAGQAIRPGAAAAARRPTRARSPIVDPRAFPPLAVEEVSPLPAPRALDLTRQPDDLWIRIRNGFAMPNLDSPLVVDRQIWYTAQPTGIRRMVERSKRYLYHIVSELEKRGMPTEIALLPMVESAFNPMAYSRAHASGLWQFIPSTGKSYNLQQNWWYDARRDVIASTTAALDYLQFLYDMHGDWHLALASYNWGENAVARAIERNKARGLPTDYLNLTMPQETRYYVPKLQALKNIITHPESFNISLDAIPNEPYFVTVPIKNMDISIAARLAQMPVDELIALNPAHNRPVIAHSDSLVLPADRAEVFKANLDNHDQPLMTWQPYTFRKGDRLDKLASQHGISLAKLRQANGITTRTRVGPGYQMILPVKGLGASTEPLPAVFTPPSVPAPARRVAAPRNTKKSTATRTATRKPAARAATKPAAKPTTKPASQRNVKPATKKPVRG